MQSKSRFAPALAALTGPILLSAFAGAAAPRLIPFPSEPLAIARHCTAIGATAQAAGRHFTNSTRAAPMAEAGWALRNKVVASGALPRTDIEAQNDDASILQEQVNTMMEQIGPPARGQFHSDRVFDELDQHTADCTAWLADRPPVMPAMPAEGAAALDHCATVMIVAQQMRNDQGPARALIVRVSRNAGEMLTEMGAARLIARAELDKRFAPPNGDLYLAGVDLILGLKMLRSADVAHPEASSVKLIDERLRLCHRTFGLQMPLQ